MVQVWFRDAKARSGAAHWGGGSGCPSGGGAGPGGADRQPALRGLQRVAHPGGGERELLEADEEEAAAGQSPDRRAAPALSQEEGKRSETPGGHQRFYSKKVSSGSESSDGSTLNF